MFNKIIPLFSLVITISFSFAACKSKVAMDGFGPGGADVSASSTACLGPAIAFATAYTITNQANGSVTLSWNASTVNNIGGYLLEYASNANFTGSSLIKEAPIMPSSVTSQSTTITGFVAPTSGCTANWFFRIRPFENTGLCTSWSATKTVTFGTASPSCGSSL